MQDILIAIQSQIHDQVGGKVDIHYTEGKGAIVVPHGATLTLENVITAIPEMQLQMMREFSYRQI